MALERGGGGREKKCGFHWMVRYAIEVSFLFLTWPLQGKLPPSLSMVLCGAWLMVKIWREGIEYFLLVRSGYFHDEKKYQFVQLLKFTFSKNGSFLDLYHPIDTLMASLVYPLGVTMRKRNNSGWLLCNNAGNVATGMVSPKLWWRHCQLFTWLISACSICIMSKCSWPIGKTMKMVSM